MPTYEYECKQCGAVSELFQPITQAPKRKLMCENCGEITPARRLLGAGAGIVFKGSGFYTTDYRSAGYKKAAEADKPKTDTKNDSSSKSSDSTKSKPDKPKAETKKAAS